MKLVAVHRMFYVQILLSRENQIEVPSCSWLNLDGFIYYTVCLWLKASYTSFSYNRCFVTTYTIKCSYELLAVSNDI